MDKGVGQGRHHGDDPKTSDEESVHKHLIPAACRSSGAAHKGAQCKYTLEFNVMYSCNVKINHV